MHTTIFKTHWGWVGLAATERGVCAVVLPMASRQAVEREMRKVLKESPSPLPSPSGGEGKKSIPPPSEGEGGGGGGDIAARHLWTARSAIIAYLSGKSRSFSLPIDLDGQTPFQKKVWQMLQAIPYGRVRSYGWVARKIGKPGAARAVGAACGANPVPLLVPCHRVVAGDGSLGGFSGGLSNKKRLLKLEGVMIQ
jgi:O-6-methylguanine DNA methyltransferase